jgi:hypothetical protein
MIKNSKDPIFNSQHAQQNHGSRWSRWS